MKFKHDRITKFGAAALAAATALTAVPAVGTFADEAKKGTITVEYTYGTADVFIPGAKFELYKVADLNLETGEIDFDAAYEDAGVDFEASDDIMATTLANYAITSDKITPVQEGTTDSKGVYTFTDVEVGAYILVGYKLEYNGYQYRCDASYFTMPSNRQIISQVESEEGGSDLFYNIKINPKLEREAPNTLEELTELEAIKIWDDDNDAYGLRPKGVEVELWQIDKEGVKTKCDTRELNAENDWRYIWTGLDKAYQYYCIEKTVPEGYAVSESNKNDKETERGFFTFTNTYKPPVLVTESVNPPGTYTKREVTKTLPYTGMLWWPVPFLAAGGLALVLIGVAGKRRRAAAERDNDE